MGHCGRCHTCGTELKSVKGGEGWCKYCKTYRRYYAHGWSCFFGSVIDDTECPAEEQILMLSERDKKEYNKEQGETSP